VGIARRWASPDRGKLIALQIAVGSREYDQAIDVNDDGRVSSVDALMILQVVREKMFIADVSQI